MEPKSAASTILVIEDSVYLRFLLAEVFEAEGYRVHTAGHGAEALRILQDTAVDVILTDLRMPVMNGLKFASVVRADARHAHIPIVLLSATPLKDSQAGQHLFSAFLWKPSPLEEIIQAVRKAQADADALEFEKSA